MRTTKKRLGNMVESINRMLGRPIAQYTKTATGQYEANIGNIHLSHAYGGIGVHVMETTGGGVRDLMGGHFPKPKVDLFLQGMMAAIREQGYAKN